MSLEALRRLCCWLALLLALAAAVMSWQASFHNPTLPPDMANPGIAMELARNAAEIHGLTNNPQNIDTLHRLQVFDEWLFIPAYTLFFAALGLYAYRVLHWSVRWSGPLVVIFVVVAAFFDYREDSGILAALANLANSQAAPTFHASYTKWSLLFLMLLLLIPLLLRRWQSATLRVLGLLFTIYILLNATPAFVACFFSGRAQIESSSSALAAPVIFFLAFVSLFHTSTMDGLNWIAALPIIRTVVSWPDIKEPKNAPVE